MLNITEYCHPDFLNAVPLWKQMRDTCAGEHRIKSEGIEYLPMTDGQAADAVGNDIEKRNTALERYERYKLRAVFTNYLRDTVISMLGVMYAEKPTKIELPEKLLPMFKNATPYNDSIEMLLRRTNENQLLLGRRSLLLEPPASGAVPKILEYAAETVLNWDIITDAESNVRLKFILLDESGNELNGLKWDEVTKYRILALDGNGFYYSLSIDENFDIDNFDIDNPPETAVYPELLGKRLDMIPFAFANASSTLPDLELPPLLSLSHMCIALYRSDADYRQHLYQQAQDTAFFKGFSEDELNQCRLGAGAAVGSTNSDADFKFVGVNSAGLPEERTALENLHTKAVNMGIALVENNGVESGEALKTRLAIKTASMKTVALSGARAVESLLKTAARWLGLNPDEVIIEPNLDFSASSAAARDLLDLWNLKLQGAPLSGRSFHEWMKKQDFTELEYDDELAQIEDELSNV